MGAPVLYAALLHVVAASWCGMILDDLYKSEINFKIVTDWTRDGLSR
jgi:hypothetical protein